MAGPRIGQIDNGYRFLGGDPGQKENWEEAASLQPGDIDSGYRFTGGDPGDKSNWEDAKKGSSVIDAVRSGVEGIANRFGSGAGLTAQEIGRVVQAPAATALEMATALGAAVSDEEHKPGRQALARQASDYADWQRKENVKNGNPVAIAGAKSEDIGKETQQYYDKRLNEVSPEMARQMAEIERADGFIGTIKAMGVNPLGTAGQVMVSVPDMAVGAAAGYGVSRLAVANPLVRSAATTAADTAAKQAFTEATIKGASDQAAAAAAKEAGQAAYVGAVQSAAERVAGSTGLVTEAAQSGMQNRIQTEQLVMDKNRVTDKVLYQQNETFRNLVDGGMSPDDARASVARELGNESGSLGSLFTGLGSKISGGAEAMGATVAGKRLTAREWLKNTGKESFEEALQNPGENWAQYEAQRQADPTQKYDFGGSVAQGMVMGAAMGGPMHGAGFIQTAIDKRRQDDGAGPSDISAATPADHILGGAEEVTPIEPAHTEAEKALYEPKSLTALDRVAQIDREIQGVAPERAAELQGEREQITKSWPAAVQGAKTSFSTETGARLEGQYALMEAGDLVTSHDTSLRKNEAYPGELQPRERDRAASEMQVSGIVQKLDPARLGLSADAATGAPIVGADGLVESGNARTIALKRVYQANGQKAEDYKQFLRSNAQQFGLDPAAVDGMRNPVLVRVRETPVNRAEFARQANASTVAQMSPSEQARADAARLDVMDDLRPDDNGDFATSRDFIRRFMAKLPATEQSGMIDSSGNLSQTGYARIRNAVLAKAYGDSPVLVRMVESMDNNLRNVGKALMQSAPEVAKVRQDVKDGALHDSDITPDLMAAVEELSALRDSGRSVREVLAQAGMFGDKYSSETRALLQFLDENIRKPHVMAEFIKAYMQALRAAGNPNQASIFGDTAAPSKRDLMTAALGGNNATAATASGSAAPGQSQNAGGQSGVQPANEGSRESGAQGNASEWVMFPAETGTLGIPRSEMPQIKGDHRGALVQFLDGQGISHKTIEEVPAEDMKPTQAEFSTKKTETWKETRDGVDRSVLISSDNYILDGHHQWVASLVMGQPVKAIKFSAPIRELLATVHQFPSAHRSVGATSDAGRTKAREDFQEALADLGAIMRDFAHVTRMVPENTPGLMPALVKLFSAGIKEVGYNVRDLMKHVKAAAKADPFLKKIWNKISDQIYMKAARQAVDKAINGMADAGPQGDLFGFQAPKPQGVTGDLFTQPTKGDSHGQVGQGKASAEVLTNSPAVVKIGGRTYQYREGANHGDNFNPGEVSEYIAKDVLDRADDYVRKYWSQKDDPVISPEDTERATSLLQPLIKRAEAVKNDYDQKVVDIAKRSGAIGQQLAPIKGLTRAIPKLVKEENFDINGMKDMLRSTIVVSDYSQAQAVIDEIVKEFTLYRKPKNRTGNTTITVNGEEISPEDPKKYGGYTDVLVNVTMPNGVIAEIQINIPSMLAAKENQGHKLYEAYRDAPKDSPLGGEINEAMQESYQAAFDYAYQRSSRKQMPPLGAPALPLGSPVSRNSDASSENLNQLPSGNITNSSPPNVGTNKQPAGNFSGTGTISTSNDNIVADQGSGAYTENGNNASGEENGNDGKHGTGGTQGEGAGSAQGAAGGRRAKPVRSGSGRGNLGSDRNPGAAAAGGEGLGQATPDATGGESQGGGRGSQGNRAGRNAGIPAGRDIPVKTGLNYSFGDNDLTYAGSWQVKARQNVEAVELLKKLEGEKHQATKEEQAVLAKFVGWGSSELANNLFGDKLDKQMAAISNYEDAIGWLNDNKRDSMQRGQGRHYSAFQVLQAKNPVAGASFYDPKYATITRAQLEAAKPDMGAKKWAELRDRLKASMSDQEWKEASRSTQYAHYTSKAVVQSMWKAMQRMGFAGGSILEPGAGIGVFPGLMPANIGTNSVYTGVEFDSVTGGILKQLFPDERILVESFIESQLPKNYYDAAIGNPPFGSTAILSDPEYKKLAFSLHDYFFAKTLDSVKPGGLVMFVTSRFTMDKLNDKARAYLADRADLVGAIRLPQTAFKKNAGTEVVTDVLFLRKKVAGETFEHGQAWSKSQPIKVKGNDYSINEYFIAHPEMVLGEHAAAGKMYGKDEYTVLPKDGDIEAHFAAAVASLPENIYQAERGSSAEAAQVRELDLNPKAKKEGNYYVNDSGVVLQREGGVGVPVEKSAKDQELLRDYVALRDALKQAHYDQLNEGDWEASLKALQKAYAAFTKKNGQVNQFTESTRTVQATDEETGETYEDEQVNRRFPLLSKLRDDPDYTLVQALENVNDDTGEITPSDFLSKRVLGKPAANDIRTPTDALLSVLNDIGHVDIDAVASRVGLTREETIDSLGSTIYEDPSAGWVMQDEYLSGNVKKKLKAAQEAVKSDRRYERNIDALMNVQPSPVPPSDITVSIGMNWIPPAVYAQFLEEKTGVRSEIFYNKATGQWTVKADSGTKTNQATADWGTDRRNAADIMEAALSGRPIRLVDTIKEAGSEKTVFNATATEAANQKLDQMREAFSSWLWQDPERTEALVTRYNDKFNTIVPRKFDGSHMTLPGTSKLFNIFDHVKRGAWRIIQDGNTYLAHAVGSGKTFQMVVSAMEQKRLGLIQKPMMVVPNHMLQQFSREWLDLYPAARLMVADENNFHTENRRRFVSRVAMSDLDGVIITHSAFKLLDLDPEFKKQVIDQELEYLRAAKAELDPEGGLRDSVSRGLGGKSQKSKSQDPRVKQLESKIQKLEEKLKAAMDGSNKDKNVRFDELGVDMVYVDEAHEFRKLGFATQRQVKGIDSSGSDKAFDLHMKVQWLRANKNPDRCLVMASGTPVTNTLAEIYSVQRFMAPDVLEERGLDDFDAWASMFGQEHTEIEADASGKYAPVTRFSRFVNVPELTQMFREFADVLTSDHLAQLLGDKRPKIRGGSRKLIVTPQTEAYSEYKKELAERLATSRAWKRSKDEPSNPDPIIKIIGDGRLASIDMRFVRPGSPSDPDSKLNQMIDGVIASYKETAANEYANKLTGKMEPAKGATQMVFSDLGFGEGVAQNRGFNARAWFEKRLRDAGIPPAHVAFMSDYKKSIAKLKLFKDMNAGRVRILVGSSKNMGTGVNAQQRLHDLSHLDTPWYPADLEQREGRGVRQGNKNKDVGLNAYSTKGSYDAVMWQMLASKQRFIDQALSGDSSVRSIDDLSEASQFQIATAMTADDPRAIQLAGVKAEIEKLQRLYRAHEEQRARMKQQYDWAGRTIELNEKSMAEARKVSDKAVDLSGDKFTGKAGRSTYTTRKEWGEAILSAFKAQADKQVTGVQQIGELSSFPIEYHGDKTGSEFRAWISISFPANIREMTGDSGVITGSFAADPVGVAMKAANAVANVARLPAKGQQLIREATDKRSALEPRLNATFQFAEMLSDKIKEADELETAMLAAQNKLTGLEREQQLEDAWQAKTGAITPLLSRGAMTGSAAFKRWFGNSKVVDENGDPLVVYHGTAENFSGFDTNTSGKNYRSTGGQKGFYFTDKPSVAGIYAEQAGYRTDGGENVMPVYLSIQNPYIRTTKLSPDKFFDYNRNSILESANKSGADGIIVRGAGRSLYVATSPEQIKSAIGNNGQFDVNNPDVTMSRGVGSGMAVRDLKAVAARVTKGFKNLPNVHVLESPAQAPAALRDYIEQAGATDTVEGAVHEGEIYLFASGMADEARAEHVLAVHEVTHYGLRGAIGKNLDSALQHVWLNNANVRRQATALRERFGLTSNVEAVEEVLVDMRPDELAKLTGWRRIVQAVRDWLRKAGAEKLAGRLDALMTKGMDDQQRADLFVADMLNAARSWAKNGKQPASVFAMDATRLAGSLSDDIAQQEKWLTREAKARGYADIEDMLAKNYPLFEKLAAKWREKNPAEALLSRVVKAWKSIAHAPEAGKPFMVYRLAGSGENSLANRNAADAEGLAAFIMSTEDFDSTISSSGDTIYAYEVTAGKLGDYATLNRGKANGDANTVGMMQKWGGHWLSFPEGAKYSSRLVGSFSLEQARAKLEELHGERIFDNVGSVKGAQAIREIMLQDFDGAALPRLSRSGQQGPDAAQRAEQIIGQSAATSRPIDAIARTLTQTVRLDSLTRKIYDKAGNLLNRWTPEQIKAGVVSDYGVPEAVLDRRTEMVGKQKQMMRKTGALLEKLATLTREESRVAYEWMNNANPQAAAYFEAQLPEESVKILGEVKRLVDDLSREAVRLGQLTQDAFERNRFEYLHRSYLKHTMELTKGETEGRRRAIAILGDQYKGRGMTDAVEMAKIKNVAPEWWGRKLTAGKADANLRGEKFIRLERRAPVGEGTIPLQENAGPGNANPLRQGKLLEVAYWPAGENVPAAYSTWNEAGTWEVRDTKIGKLILWRDFSKSERTAMGEIDEARYAIAKTLHGMIQDIETGRYLEYLAQRWAKKAGETLDGEVVDASESMRQSFPPGTWVKVPETKIQGTSTLKYGTLAGRYLPGPIWNDVRQTVGFRFKPFGETFGAIMSAWKTSKTALSPAVHLNNVMANFVMADWHDVTAGHTLKALRILMAANDRTGTGALGRIGNLAARAGVSDREAAAEILARFQESGGSLGTWATAELQKEQLEPLLKALENELGTAGETAGVQVGTMAALQQMMQMAKNKEFRAIFAHAATAYKTSKVGQVVSNESRNLIAMYEAEDQVFRLATWLKAKEEGATDMAAGKLARRSFLDYHINAPWVQAARGTVLPFVAFTYRAVPMMLETAAKKPWKLMKLAALAGALNALGYLLSGGDEDDERKLLPEEKAGRIWGLVPKLIRMPWNDSSNNPVFLDIRRFIPIGDIFDTGQSHSAIPILPAIVPGGPAALLAELVLNRQQFTGRAITEETDTATEKAAKIMDYLYKSFAPNLVLLPGTYAYSGVVNAAKGRTDTFGREQSVAQAAASSIGIKLGSYPKDVLQMNAMRETQAKMMEIDRNITAIKREYQKHGITAEEFQKELRKQQDKKQKVQDELTKRMNGKG